MSVEINVACRTLAEFVHREGGLSPITFYPMDMTAGAGTRAHQAFYKELENHIPGATARSEVRVSGRFEQPDLTLLLSGRSDLVVEPAEGYPFAMEVKTVGVPLEKLDQEGLVVHWAQVRLYAWLLVQDDIEARETNRDIRYALAYVSREDLASLLIYRTMPYRELENWFKETCLAYVSFARIQKEYKDRSLASIRQLRFPYPALRDGQKPFMEKVLKNLRSRTPLLVQAPTGTGKTMSTLYPAIKGLGAGMHQQIFYLTAKTSTREVAAGAMRALRQQGLIMRSVNMTAKEKLCLKTELYCDTQLCPYAKDYYKNINGALEDALAAEDFDARVITQLAEKHNVCPFELQLDISLYADVIICDYNYAFDPRVRLERFFAEAVFHHALLIDEAHNLPDRAREMYSATLSMKELEAALKALEAYDPRLTAWGKPLEHYFRTLNDAFLPIRHKAPAIAAKGNTASGNGTLSAAERLAAARAALAGAEPDRPADVPDTPPLLPDRDMEEKREAAWPLVEPDITIDAVMKAQDFRGTRLQPKNLMQKLWFFCHQIRDVIDDIDDFKMKQDVLAFYFSARFFLRVTDEFWSSHYILAAKAGPGGLEIAALCLDSSDRIVQSFRGAHSAVFFSATLTPLHYFAREFCGTLPDDKPDTMVLASPFPRENLLLAVASGIRTTYAERRNSQMDLAKAIALGLMAAGGNSLVFFPSYAYMQQVLPSVRRLLRDQPIDILTQTSQMSEEQRQSFLDSFSEIQKEGRSMAGFAVLGGIFGEGIDLTGDRLKAVIVVGVGIPQISPEREILQQYYAAQGQGGFQFAYTYPGFNKVLQAAGRLIRSETDTGLILLIDERYERPEYRQLFPDEWIPEFCSTLPELKKCLEGIPRST